MNLKIDEWEFDIDLTATMINSAEEVEGHCECGYCRNFYAAVDNAYPNLRTFLAQFGVDIEGPSELLPFEPTVYLAGYLVKGEIIRKSLDPINIDGIPVTAESEGEPGWFRLTIGELELPWTLAEPVDDIQSPANDPNFLCMMMQRRLNRFRGDCLYS